MRKVKTGRNRNGSSAINISAVTWAIIDGEFIIRDTKRHNHNHGGERRSK